MKHFTTLVIATSQLTKSSVGSETSCQRSQMVRSPTQPSPSSPVYLTLHGDNRTSQTNHAATPYHEAEGLPK